MSWLKDLLHKAAGKDPETNREQEVERQVKANAWIDGVMDINEKDIEKAAAVEQNELETLRGVQKEGAYVLGDTPEGTIKKDYQLRIKSLSNYNLAEMLLEYKLIDKGLATTVQAEEKEKMKKYVEGNREEAERRLLNHLGTHSYLDCVKAFEKFKDAERVDAKGEDLYAPERKEGKQYWEKESEHEEVSSDKEHLEQMDGVGDEEAKGQVGKEASDVTDKIRKKVVKKINDVVDEELDDKVIMEKEDAVEEHERLTDVLESPSHEDDKEEAEVQEEELEEYKEASLASVDELKEYGFSDQQIKYLQKADKLVRSNKAHSVDDIEMKLGYGVIDTAVLQDTFFSDKEAKVTHSDTCERCKELYPAVCEVCKKDKANEIGDYRKGEIKQKVTKEAMKWETTSEGYAKPVERIEGTDVVVWQVTKDDVAAGFPSRAFGKWAVEDEGTVFNFYFSQDVAKEQAEKLAKRATAEIKSKMTKEAALKKIAEVDSTWFVTENAQGEKVIAKRTPSKATKLSKEEEEEKLRAQRI